MPATAAIARTSVAIKAGQQTRLTGIIHSLGLLASMFLLSGVMSRIPMAALAGVLMVTAWRMNDWSGIRYIFSHRFKSGISQFLITMIATVVFDLTVAILIGIACAAVMFLLNAGRLTVEISRVDEGRLARLKRMGRAADPGAANTMLVTYVTGSLFFGNTGELKAQLSSIDFTDCDKLILSLRGVPAADISGVQTLTEACVAIRDKGVQVSLCGVHPVVREFFDKAGLTDAMGTEVYYQSVSDAMLALLPEA